MDVAEMVVRAIPEGVGEVQDELDGMTESVEESGEQMEETADDFADLQKRFSGAGAAIAGAFAATTGLFLGRVPILSETIDALGAVFNALGLQVDSLLRGPFTRFNNFLFGLSDTISQAEGPLGDLIGAFSALLAALAGGITAFAGAKIATLGWKAGLKATAKVLASVITTVGTFIAGIVSLPVLLAAAGVAVLALAYIYRDELIDALQGAVSWLESFGAKVAQAGRNALSTAGDFVSGLASRFTDLVANAREWGRDVMVMFITGVRSMVGALGDLLEDIPFIGRVLELFDVVIDALRGNDLDIVGDLGSGDVGGSISARASNVRDSGSDFIGSVGGGGGTINLDGRNIENTQGRYRADNLHRRGG